MKKAKIWNIVSPILIIGTTALVILFSRGWRINLKDRTVVSTGILDISSDPKGSSIYINGEKKETTPAVIDSLTAGQYIVELRKENYVNWQKTINIEEEKVNKIVANLFEEKAELKQTSDFPIEKVIFSKSGDQALVINKRNNFQGVWKLQLGQSFFQLEKGNIKITDLIEAVGMNLVNSDSEIFVNDDFSSAIIKTVATESQEVNYYLIDIQKENSNIKIITDAIPDNSEITWSPDNKHLIIKNNLQLLSLNTDTLQEFVITNQLENIWDADKTNIYYVTKATDQTKIYKSNLDGTNREEVKINVDMITKVNGLAINEEYNKLMIFLDSSILTFDIREKTFTKTDKILSLVSKSPDLEYFLLQNQQGEEIYVYGFEQEVLMAFENSTNIEPKNLTWSPNSLRLFARKTDDTGTNSVYSYDYDGTNYIETVKFESFNGSLTTEFGFSSDSKKVFLPLPSNIQTITEGEDESKLIEEVLYEISLR